MKLLRKKLTKQQVEIKSKYIKNSILSLDEFKNSKNILTYMSAFNEPDTFMFIDTAISMGKNIIVPITDIKTKTLSLSYIENISDLKKGAYNIYEPKKIKNCDINNVELIFVPGIAFDKFGGRIGFGEGYYDRLLNNTDCIKIGICYDFQLMDKIPTCEHDVLMDMIITERDVIYCEKI